MKEDKELCSCCKTYKKPEDTRIEYEDIICLSCLYEMGGNFDWQADC
ncbi:MAG: hypothetical protein GY714_08060 [Desulfobacterales bacterium]|nr:hypothetical protein [Desulfobacterales bacterium]